MSGYDYVSSSFDPLPDDLRRGMISLGIFGLISSISTLSLLVFITYRMIYWRKYYDESIASNQIFILIYNLLLADLQQALSFLISFYWISQNKIVGPSPACFAQGWLIQIGDMSSGLWVLAIAVHTFIGLVSQKVVPMRTFIIAVISLWMFCLILTAIGPIMIRKDLFVPAGAWCWINEDRQDERLYLHYLWIFVSQLGSLVIYISIFFFLRTRISGSNVFNPSAHQAASQSNTSNDFSKSGAGTTTTIMSAKNDAFAVSRRRIMRTARYMVVYPFAYVALTLPLASGRVSAMAGHEPPLAFYPVAGTLMACCGITDVLLYLWTRKALLKSSVGIKPLSTSESGTERRVPTNGGPGSIQGDQVRMNRLTKNVPSKDHTSAFHLTKGSIVVSKSVTTTRSQNALQNEREDYSSERTDSLKSLVMKKDFRKSWLQRSVIDYRIVSPAKRLLFSVRSLLFQLSQS